MQLRCLTLALCITFSASIHAEEPSAVSRINSCARAIGEGDASKALAYVEPVLKQDKNNRDALLCKGRAHGLIGQNKEAQAAFEAAEKLSTTPKERMLALDLIGNVQKSNGQFAEALGSYQQSLKLAQDEKHAYFTRIAHNLIGDVYVATGKFQDALTSFKAASDLGGNGNERADSYERIAATYDAMDDHDKAVEYQIKAVVTEEAYGDLDHRANAGLEMGRLYTAAGNYPKAEVAINKIVQLAKEQGGAYWEAKSYYYLGLTKAKSNDLAQAKTLLADARQITAEIGADELKAEIEQAQEKLPK